MDWPEAVACPSAVNRRIHARPCRSSRGAKPASPLIDSTVAWSCGCCSIRTPAPAAAASAATSCFEGASKTHHNVPPRRKTAAATGRSHVKRSDASRLSGCTAGAPASDKLAASPVGAVADAGSVGTEAGERGGSAICMRGGPAGCGRGSAAGSAAVAGAATPVDFEGARISTTTLLFSRMSRKEDPAGTFSVTFVLSPRRFVSPPWMYLRSFRLNCRTSNSAGRSKTMVSVPGAPSTE